MVFSQDIKKLFCYKKETEVREINIKIYELEHIKTKAKILLYETKDDNKVFNICFKTPVNNNKGIPHILEHSVLCGSNKYNVKDPFVELAKSSLNTFLNAMTFLDKTCYPVASCNLKDFKNLMDVYLDAVFFPNIYKNKYIFMQEGWHYEIDDKNTEIIRNGVVFNEMKGVFSDPQGILEHSILESLYSGTNYMYESGGMPNEIVNLTYDEFLDFHKRYYSPTNSIISLYGDMDFNERLKYIDEYYLSKFDYVDINSFNINNVSNNIVKDINIKYFDSKNTDNNILSFNYLLNEEKDTISHIVLLVLNYILFGQEGAIIKDKLIKLNLCDTVLSQYEHSFKKGYFSIVLHNVILDNEYDSDKIFSIKNKINDLLIELVNNGISKDKLVAGINSVHFSFFDNDTMYPKGLNYILNSLDSYLYGQDVDIFIKYKKAFEYLENENLDSKNNIFINTIKELFLDNEMTSTSLIYPKTDLIVENSISEKKALNEFKNSLSSEQINNIIDENNNLKIYQSEIDDFSCLPTLDLKDIDRKKIVADFDILDVYGKNTLFTNNDNEELIYFNFNIKLPKLSNIEKYYLSILTKLFTKVSTKNYSYSELNNLIDTYTGQFSINVSVVFNISYLKVSIKTTKKNFYKAIEILKEVLFNTKISEVERIKSILLECRIESNLSVQNNGHIASLNRASSNISLTSNYFDYMSINGISFNMFLNELLKKYDENVLLIFNNLNISYSSILNNKDIFFDFLCSYDNQKMCKDGIKKIKDGFNCIKIDNENNFLEFFDINKFDRVSKSEGFITNSDVNFVSRVGKFNNKYTGVLQLVKTILSYDYLWTNIRVLGGAYGMGVKINREGNICFTTYRDPNLSKSDIVFKDIIKYLENINFSDEILTKYKIGTIGTIDMTLNDVMRHERNVRLYLLNITNEELNRERSEILDANIFDIKNTINILREVIYTNEICSLISEKNREEGKEYYKNVKDLFFNE